MCVRRRSSGLCGLAVRLLLLTHGKLTLQANAWEAGRILVLVLGRRDRCARGPQQLRPRLDLGALGEEAAQCKQVFGAVSGRGTAAGVAVEVHERERAATCQVERAQHRETRAHLLCCALRQSAGQSAHPLYQLRGRHVVQRRMAPRQGARALHQLGIQLERPAFGAHQCLEGVQAELLERLLAPPGRARCDRRRCRERHVRTGSRRAGGRRRIRRNHTDLRVNACKVGVVKVPGATAGLVEPQVSGVHTDDARQPRRLRLIAERRQTAHVQ
mmetsp:Transcript_31636/g.79345  ORF Transcript_31636/g.79345 Transcript_31636/m.79345 type:complete len:272 (-) Transcript_31636:471-1286(-)